VHAEPILMVPAWIMKYYVMDLSPENSLVRHLVAQGFTVFIISWKNPNREDRDLDMDDYAQLGMQEALGEIARILPGVKVHVCGYCLGGTLVAIVAASLGRSGSEALKSVTLLASQTDFTEPGELGLFIDESQLAFLDRMTWRAGFLDKGDMRRAFQLLRSNDLVWSYRTRSQLLGERQRFTDLMAWNADGTRLPRRMYMQYMRDFFLRNALARGLFELHGTAVNLADIRVPIFNVGTVQDHVAPWRSVFKLQSLTDAEQTFVLTAGGHNVGIVNPPDNRIPSSYRLRVQRPGDRLLTADQWLTATEPIAGSWWEAWVAWLARHSGRRVEARVPAAPSEGAALGNAPGLYVHQR
jgi:polyhydroxyalkanoate synthase